MKNNYSYIAIFDFAEDGISIEFPDLPGCLSCADTEEEAFKCAEEVLGLYLYSLEIDKEKIPVPSKLKQLSLASNQIPVFTNVFMPLVRKQVQNVSVKKTLTIPSWLNELAEEKNINFSQCLQTALKEQLNVNF